MFRFVIMDRGIDSHLLQAFCFLKNDHVENFFERNKPGQAWRCFLPEQKRGKPTEAA